MTSPSQSILRKIKTQGATWRLGITDVSVCVSATLPCNTLVSVGLSTILAEVVMVADYHNLNYTVSLFQDTPSSPSSSILHLARHGSPNVRVRCGVLRTTTAATIGSSLSSCDSLVAQPLADWPTVCAAPPRTTRMRCFLLGNVEDPTYCVAEYSSVQLVKVA